MIIKEKTLIIILIAALIGALGAIFYFSNLSQNLKADLLESQASTEKRITNLEEKIGRLNVPSSDKSEQEIKENTESQTPPVATGTPQFMSEEELLKNYFTQNPTLIMPGGENAAPHEADANGPILTVTPPIFDLGTIRKSAGKAEAQFELKNTGKADLSINYALSSCGCTSAPLKEEKVLKPGESYMLAVTYDPNFYGQDYELGFVEKTVTIFSNYAAQPFYRVKLKANVTP